MESITIARRFCGPPHSGNGGYVCGVLGRRLAGAATVRLTSPPPLETALQLAAEGDVLQLGNAGQAIAQARPAELAIEAPEAPSLAQAREATSRYPGFASHPFPGCFVCGPARAEGDGLRIFPGRVTGRDLVAAPWTPGSDLADGQGRVQAEFVWSALDCTGFFAFAPLPEGAPALLGEMTTRIDAAVEPGAPHVVVGWLIGSEGRKRFAGSALFNAGGELLGIARATWLVMPAGAAGAV